MARSSLIAVLALLAPLPAAASLSGAGDLAAASLDHDDECAAAADGEASEACALAALQLRASRKAHEAAQAASRHPAGLPPGADDEDDEDDDDDDADKGDDAPSEAPASDDSEKEEESKDADEGKKDGDEGKKEEGKKEEGKKEEDKKEDDKDTKGKKGEDDDDDDDDDEDDHKEEQHSNRPAAGGQGGRQDPLKKQAPMPKAKKGSTNPIVIKSNFLYDSKTGSRFFAKGVAYNPRNQVFDLRLMKEGNCTPGEPVAPKLSYAADPTAEDLEGTWKEALNAIANLGANTVRLYNINPELSHKKFMDYAASLGLYVIVPLTRHDWGFLPAGSPAPLCYTEEIDQYGNVGTNLLTSAKLIVKEFSQYDNTLLFTVANELTIADVNGYAAFPCVKALTRDIHQYQAQCKDSMRRVPLIYADMDMGPPYRELVGRYLACEVESEDDAVDAYGLNVYSWCDTEYPDETGKNNFMYSPYGPIKTEFESFAKPLIFTEFGCTLGEFMTSCPYNGGRTWPDVKTFFQDFKEIVSGAVAFEFSMEDNQYGLALTPGFTSDPNNDGKFYYLDAFYALQKQFTKYSVSSEWDGAKASDCAWTPSKAAKLAKSHKSVGCPNKKEVAKLFDAKGLPVAPNWDALPPTPKGADQDLLEHCPVYEVAPELKKEGCCHYSCK